MVFINSLRRSGAEGMIFYDLRHETKDK